MTTAAPLQALLLNRLYVTVPDAWKAPVSVAESVTEPPTAIVKADKLVKIAGLAMLTVRGSHDEVAPLLFASPL
jgi:hypothetical protein